MEDFKENSIEQVENKEFWSNPKTNMIKEYRIVLPLCVDEYKIGQQYGILDTIKEMKDCHGNIKWIKNEEIKTEHGLAQYIERNIPLIPDKDRNRWCARYFGSKGMLDILETSYDTYPSCRTRYSNKYMKDNFQLVVDSQHQDGVNKNNNIFNLNEEDLAKREVVYIDIVNDKVKPDKCCTELPPDPSEFTSKTGRGPFKGPFWPASEDSVMTVYKLVRLEFKWWGLQTCVEKAIYEGIHKGLFTFNRKVVCSMDSWLAMDKTDLQQFEERVKEEIKF